MKKISTLPPSRPCSSPSPLTLFCDLVISNIIVTLEIVFLKEIKIKNIKCFTETDGNY